MLLPSLYYTQSTFRVQVIMVQPLWVVGLLKTPKPQTLGNQSCHSLKNLNADLNTGFRVLGASGVLFLLLWAIVQRLKGLGLGAFLYP